MSLNYLYIYILWTINKGDKMEGYYETKAGYDFWKKQYNDDIALGFTEETDVGKYDVNMYNKYQNGLLAEISEVKYQILNNNDDSFSKAIAITDAIIALSQSDDDKLYFLTNTDRAIDVLLKCLNNIFKLLSENQGFNTSGLTYYQNKDYSDDLITQLIDKCGWEIIIEKLINLESSEILCVDYQLEEYQLIVYDDKIKAFNDIKNNIIDIESNTDLFNEYNNEISKTIDKYWDIIDFDYDNYYGLVRC